MSKVLEIVNLTKKYGKLTAVDNLSFSIEKGKIYGLLGPNGSGKSTTLGIILEVVNKTSGKVIWFENQISAREGLKKTGAIIERPNFYPYLSAWQNLELVCMIKEIPTVNINEKLKLVNLFDRKDDLFKNFSLGMKQRLAIASSLLNEPDLLILDEPTNGLDPKGIREIREVIKLVASRGKTIILASHLLDEVEKVCDHVIVLEDGKKIYDGEVTELINHKTWWEVDIEKPDEVLFNLSHNPNITSIRKEKNLLRIYTNLSGKELNKLLINKGFYANQIYIKKASLEKVFIDITQ